METVCKPNMFTLPIFAIRHFHEVPSTGEGLVKGHCHVPSSGLMSHPLTS